MNKTATTELHRTFLLENLPEPLTRASSHLQIYDNYIENTRLRLRSIRDPYSTAWTHVLQQRFSVNEADLAVSKMSEIHLNDAEHAIFERFMGREIRKNRYFHEFDRALLAFDVYLGRLWGLNTVRIDFDMLDEMHRFVTPPFAIFEVTNDPLFDGANLITKTFADIQAEVAKLGSEPPIASEMPDQ